jgi:hemoglobin
MFANATWGAASGAPCGISGTIAVPAVRRLHLNCAQRVASLCFVAPLAICSDAKLGLNIMEEADIYALIGEDGFARLVAAFYRQVPQDDILGAMYPKDDLAAAEQRLRDFLIYRFGGPQRYIEERGHPRLRARHIPFRIDQAARDRWMQLMNNAFAEAALPAEAEQFLRAFLGPMSTFMINR